MALFGRLGGQGRKKDGIHYLVDSCSWGRVHFTTHFALLGPTFIRF